ncbi:exopolygalacturonase-like protein [Cinnamomum micranthum f. kanehirae]|uniref:Exopolygalacturonase-like protein n=1 Tax=Cinnamomum micranthum f. kanehirae TaxID=337451 RepID=A0A3S3NS46_9MAGN|nr:exopolygalacturonase-like protein [Cinnamomum micranthum f. kanehirae]
MQWFGAYLPSIASFFHMNIFRCNNIKLQSIDISAPDESPNTDGIHIGSSNGINISRSIIGPGDDCISLGPGQYQRHHIQHFLWTWPWQLRML